MDAPGVDGKGLASPAPGSANAGLGSTASTANLPANADAIDKLAKPGAGQILNDNGNAAGAKAGSNGTGTGSTNNSGTNPGSNTGREAPPGAPAQPFNHVSAHTIQGGGAVHGSVFITNNHASGPGLAAAWEDDLISMSRLLPEPGRPVDSEEVERQAAALHDKRLLLISHAPHLDQDALAAMRAVVQVLQKRYPERGIFAGRPAGTLTLRKVSGAAWREDRRNALVYLNHSADPASRTFFDSIEEVEQLRAQLEQMGAHLVLTVSTSRATVLREKADLARRTALWIFDDPEQAAIADAATLETFATPFEVTVALCAALFPGLGVAEFMALVDRLAPDPSLPPAAAASVGASAADAALRLRRPPRNRHERWWRGERDGVLAELGVRLCRPNEGSEFAAAEKGMFFEDAGRRVELPAWLFERYPILLGQHVEALTDYYLAADASAQFRAGYRHFVLRLAQLNIHQLTAEWLLRKLRASLDASRDYAASRNLAELMAELPDTLHGKPLVVDFVNAVGALIPEQEKALIESLQAGKLLPPAAEDATLPYTVNFWLGLKAQAAAVPVIDEAVWRLAVPIHLLQALSARASSTVAGALGKALADSDALHVPWVQAAGLAREGKTPLSLARQVFREMQAAMLNEAPGLWLHLAGAIAEAYAPPAVAPSRNGSTAKGARATAEPGAADATEARERSARAASGRRLAWDCIVTFATLFNQPTFKRLSPAVHAALLGADAYRRLGQLLAQLLRLTAPPQWRLGDAAAAAEGRAEDDAEADDDAEATVDTGSVMWIYMSLALAAMAHGKPAAPAAAAEAAGVLLIELAAPLRTVLRSAQRVELLDTARGGIDVLFAERDALPDDFEQRVQTQDKRREYTRQIQALQIVMRALRSSPRPTR